MIKVQMTKVTVAVMAEVVATSTREKKKVVYTHTHLYCVHIYEQDGRPCFWRQAQLLATNNSK